MYGFNICDDNITDCITAIKPCSLSNNEINIINELNVLLQCRNGLMYINGFPKEDIKRLINLICCD